MLSRTENGQYTFMDLFAGAGGLSEGFIQAGFRPVAHIEMDEYAVQTLQTRAAYHFLKSNGQLRIYHKYLSGDLDRDDLLDYVPEDKLNNIFRETMSVETLPGLFKSVDRQLERNNIGHVDVIIGGPPCQAYSIVGRAQSSHMEIPMEQDPRNDLYKLYIRFLEKYRPAMFAFENVAGIMTANGGSVWESLKEHIVNAGYDMNCEIRNAKDFGVLQNRKRMVIVGWRRDRALGCPEFRHITFDAVVNDLLSDLPPLHPGESADQYLSAEMSPYLRKTKIRIPGDILTLHCSRPNTDRDIAIYKRAVELWNEGRRLNYNDLPDDLKTHKNRKSFTDRFKVVEGNDPYCHTMLAHISKDGHYFIHPDIQQHRSLTVREAARIQSFPDSYYFEGPRTSQFVQIGNAVPPLMARGIAGGIADVLDREASDGQQSPA